jgi:ATP-dependent protease ClpP protease subunit
MADRWCELMAKHTKKDAKYWLKHCQGVGDHFFDAQEAQDIGLIDHIWDEKEGEIDV